MKCNDHEFIHNEENMEAEVDVTVQSRKGRYLLQTELGRGAFGVVL